MKKVNISPACPPTSGEDFWSGYEMKKLEKPRMVMLGICSQCGNILVRPSPADTAICTCKSILEVPLVPYVQVSVKLAKKILENPAIPIIILPKRRRHTETKHRRNVKAKAEVE